MRNDTIALIPARKGSTRVKDKNIRLLGGKPLISRTVENALSVLPSSSIYLSTNDERIFPIANKYNVNLVRRPEKVSKVDSSMEEVIYSFLESIPRAISLAFSQLSKVSISGTKLLTQR